jgi:hypothetical protein
VNPKGLLINDKCRRLRGDDNIILVPIKGLPFATIRLTDNNSIMMIFGVYLLILRRAVLRYICRLLAGVVYLLVNMRVF